MRGEYETTGPMGPAPRPPPPRRRVGAGQTPARMASASSLSSRACVRARALDGSRRRASARTSARATRCASASATKPWTERDCRLVLEDGSVWRGRAFGARATQVGEVVFNTSLSGCVMDSIVVECA